MTGCGRRLAAVLAALASSLVAHAAGIDLEPCSIEAAGGRQEVKAQCGELQVPLDPGAPDGDRIGLHVAVVPALSEERRPDPLTVIAGGPGEASTRFYVAVRNAFGQIARRRDIVLVDQRGTGRSAPLDCPGMADQALAWSAEDEVEQTVAMTLECLAESEHDPRFFTTSVAVADLEAVREALGYEQFNIYGVSYGSRVAQHYLRRYPGHTRSVILDGLVPPTVALGPDTTTESQAAVEALFERCEDDPPCASAFPDFRTTFDAVLERLESAPAELTVAHPRSGEPTPVTLSRTVAVGIVRLLVYSPMTAGMLPVLFQEASEGRLERLAVQALMLAEGIEEIAYGLNFAVVCTEDVPFWGAVDLEAQRATYMGSTFVEVLDGVCERRPRGLMDDDFRTAVQSDAPVLILTGELDPITPPRYVPLVAGALGNHVEVVGRGQGHGMLAVGCVPRLMAQFVDGIEPGALDLSCVERIRPFPPFSSLMGPGP